MSTGESGLFSTSLARGLSVLALFSPSRPELTVQEIAKCLGMNRTTAYRYVVTLRKLGYVEIVNETNAYRLSLGAVGLGLTALASSEVRIVGRPVLRTLGRQLQRTVNMGVLDQNEMVFIERIRTLGGIDLNLNVGSRLPLERTSMGKVLLAYAQPEVLDSLLARICPETSEDPGGNRRRKLLAELRVIRKNGFATNNEELAAGLRSVAAPVFRAGGDVVAAINAACSVHDTTMQAMRSDIAPAVVASASEISRRLGAHPDFVMQSEPNLDRTPARCVRRSATLVPGP